MNTIVVADDEPMLRSLVSRMLADHGYTTLEAPDGAAALDILTVPDRKVALVLSDIVMPRLDGISLLERLSRSHPGLPVVLMSGYSDAELAVRTFAAPCGILRKPFSAAMLIAEVRRCLTAAA